MHQGLQRIFFRKGRKYTLCVRSVKKTKTEVQMLTNSNIVLDIVASTKQFENLIEDSAVMVDVGGAGCRLRILKTVLL